MCTLTSIRFAIQTVIDVHFAKTKTFGLRLCGGCAQFTKSTIKRLCIKSGVMVSLKVHFNTVHCTQCES